MTNVSQSRTWQIDALLTSSRTSTPFVSNLGQVFASIPVQLEGSQVVPLHSNVYRNWLLSRFQSEHSVVPRPSAIRDVVQSLEAKVEFPAEQNTAPSAKPAIARRIASSPGKLGPGVLLDLHNDQGEAVEITASGWRITQNLTGYFRAARSARPLPHPEPAPKKTFDKLQALLGLTPEHFTRCVSWLTAAMSPTGPYPILVLQGASSSAKSAVASMLRALIDPGPAPFCPLPSSARDLRSLALHNWIVALDNVDLLPPATVRKLMRLSTGIVFAVRDKSSDPEPFHFHVERPMLFTTETALRLGERAIVIELPPNAAPISQAEFEALRPRLLGALCTGTAVSKGVSPDWRKFTGSPDPIAIAVATFMESQTEWSGSATELLLRLREQSPNLAWPETPKGLTQLLRRTALDNIDVQSVQKPNGNRSLLLTKIKKGANRSADAQESVPVGQAFPPAAVDSPSANPKPNRARKQAAPQIPHQSPKTHSP